MLNLWNWKMTVYNIIYKSIREKKYDRYGIEIIAIIQAPDSVKAIHYITETNMCMKTQPSPYLRQIKYLYNTTKEKKDEKITCNWLILKDRSVQGRKIQNTLKENTT